MRPVPALCGAAILFAAGAAAAAEDRPQLLPQRDAAVTYRIESSARGAPGGARVLYKAGGGLLRVEPDNQPGYAIVDRAGNRAEMVLPQAHLVMHIGLGDAIDRYVLNPQARFRRLGQDQVAGLACTTWEMHAPDAEGTGCVTDDGLILRAAGHDRRGQQASLEATSVTYAPQPAEAFAPPAGSRSLNLSNLGLSGSIR